MTSTARKIDLHTDSYPALSEMGIVNFHEISHYSLRQDGRDKDILRVNYKRSKGSLLPFSRKYKFGRSLKTVIADGGTARMEDTYEISPFLLKAIAELDSLLANARIQNTDRADKELKGDLLDEIVALEQLLQTTDADTRPALLAQVKVVRQHIEAL